MQGFQNRNIFKVYALDVGLLSAMANIPAERWLSGDKAFSEYAGAFTENYVAQQLTALYGPNLTYWKSRGGKAEVDFLVDLHGEIIPLEVKAGINPKSKSLHSYNNLYQPPLLLRTSLLNLKQDDRLCNIPLYGLESLPGLWNFMRRAQQDHP